MDKELDDALCRDFPLLFRDRHEDMAKTSMCWGFPGDGWEPLIRRLAEMLEPILDDWLDDETRPTASQVKEKFGEMRFYMTHGTPEILKLIDDAEMESELICEKCGEPGDLRTNGWWRTLCDPCEKVRYEAKE